MSCFSIRGEEKVSCSRLGFFLLSVRRKYSNSHQSTGLFHSEKILHCSKSTNQVTLKRTYGMKSFPTTWSNIYSPQWYQDQFCEFLQGKNLAVFFLLQQPQPSHSVRQKHSSHLSLLSTTIPWLLVQAG